MTDTVNLEMLKINQVCGLVAKCFETLSSFIKGGGRGEFFLQFVNYFAHFNWVVRSTHLALINQLQGSQENVWEKEKLKEKKEETLGLKIEFVICLQL